MPTCKNQIKKQKEKKKAHSPNGPGSGPRVTAPACRRRRSARSERATAIGSLDLTHPLQPSAVAIVEPNRLAHLHRTGSAGTITGSAWGRSYYYRRWALGWSPLLLLLLWGGARMEPAATAATIARSAAGWSLHPPPCAYALLERPAYAPRASAPPEGAHARPRTSATSPAVVALGGSATALHRRIRPRGGERGTAPRRERGALRGEQECRHARE